MTEPIDPGQLERDLEVLPQETKPTSTELMHRWWGKLPIKLDPVAELKRDYSFHKPTK